MSLHTRISSGDFALAVVGLGRVGLPMAIAFANAGVRRVFGVEKNSEIVADLMRGCVPFLDEGLQVELDKARSKDAIEIAQTPHKIIPQCDVVIVSVGTPLDENFAPDVSGVIGLVDELAPLMKGGSLLIMRSTLTPGLMRSTIVPRLRERSASKINVAVCPERILGGKALRELRELPEIVGADDPESQELAKRLFKLLGNTKQILLTDSASAEMAKLFSNVYRYVNFALANEFGILAEQLGLDARHIIDVANHGYKRGGIPMPGLSGGPCLYKDGHFLVSGLPFIDFIRAAWHLNESIPDYVISCVKAKHGSLYGKQIGVLGLAYKAGSDDVRYSPSVKLVNRLRSEGARVVVHDPFVKGTSTLDDALDAEIVILACNHPEFAAINENRFGRVRFIYDCWGLYLSRVSEFKKRGITYGAFGVGKVND